MPEMTPEQKRRASATELKRLLPAKGTGAQTVVSDAALKRGDQEVGVMSDPVNRPTHYTSHPSGVECITVTEHMGFNLGNAVKYIWRADLKSDAVEDLQKARWYIDREIARRGGA